jgi:multisubunit Na+/H+ antiporter MnhB subunit
VNRPVRSHARRGRFVDRLPLNLPVAMVLLIGGLGFARVLAEHWREGTGLLGGALLVAAVSRVLLPEDRAGLLGVRSKPVDVLLYTGFGVLMVVLAFTIPRTPFIIRE